MRICFEFQLLKHSATGQSFSGDSLDLQAALHDLAGGFRVLIERVGVDIQRGRRLTVSEQSSNCADIRAAGDEQACRRVAQAVDIQVYVFAKQCQHVYVMDMCQNEAFISRKIRINAIAPGMTKTGLTDDFNASICGDAEKGQAILEKLFLAPWNGRWASAEEMGYPMAAVSSHLFSYMSGQILYIDYSCVSQPPA